MKLLLLLLSLTLSMSVMASSAKTLDAAIMYYKGSSAFKNHVLISFDRSKRYSDFIKQKLLEYGLPISLAYLPIIESGFDKFAISPSIAVGLWQLKIPAARDMGICQNELCTQRFDPKKSTIGAVKYLKFLNKKFPDIYLTLAAYNAGPGYMKSRIKKYNTLDINKLSLKQETLDYVAKFIVLEDIISKIKD